MNDQPGMNPHQEQPSNQEINAQQERTNPHHEMNPHHQQSYHQEMGMQPMEHNPHTQQMYETCKKYQLYFVQIQTTDGKMYDGIIEDVDNEGVTMLMPYGDMEQEEGMERQFGYGYGGFGFPRRFRRFRRFRFPFFLLSSLFFPFYY